MSDLIKRLRNELRDLFSEAADALEAANARIAELEADVAENDALIDQLRAQIGADMKDAERYRWLRAFDLCGEWKDGMPYVAADNPHRNLPIVLVGTECDEAIDSALAKQQRGE